MKYHDIGFAVREIPDQTASMNINNLSSSSHHPSQGNADVANQIIVIQPLQRFSSEAQIQGKLPPADRARNINLLFDNSHSHLQRKTIVFWVAIG